MIGYIGNLLTKKYAMGGPVDPNPQLGFGAAPAPVAAPLPIAKQKKKKPELVQTANAQQVQQAAQQQQQALGAQNSLAQQLAAQGGMQNQANVFGQQQGLVGQQQGLADQLAAQARGEGPNPALQQLQNQTGQNVANQAALMAGQRGAGSNVGLMARQVAGQGAGIQQQAVGQGALMQAQQQIAAQQALGQQQQAMGQTMGQMGGMANQQVANQMSGQSMVTNAALQGQQNMLNAAGQENAITAAGQQGSANRKAGILGGLLNAAGAVGSVLAAPVTGGASLAGLAPMVKGLAGGSGGNSMNAAHGAVVPGHAEVSGDSEQNDKVPAMLSPGEIVVPRSAASSPDKASAFVKQVIQNKTPSKFEGFEKTSEDEHSTTLRHPSGHQIMIAHGMLVPEHREMLRALPKYAQGGMAGRGGQELDPTTASMGDALRDSVKNIPSALAGIGNDIAQSGGTPIGYMGNKALQGFQSLVKGGTQYMDAKEAAQDQQALGGQGIQKAFYDPNSHVEGTQQMAAPQAQGANPYQSALGMESKGLDMQAKAEQDAAKRRAEIEANHVKYLETEASEYGRNKGNLQKEREMLIGDYKNQKIDPNRYFSNMGTGQKIGNILGILASGVGSGLSGGPNLALNMIHDNIEKDIDAQKESLGQKKTLLSENLAKFRDLEDAMKMTRVQQADMLAAKLDEASARAASPMAAARMQQAKGALMAKYEPEIEEMARKNATNSALAMSGGNIDPAMLVAQKVPKEHQKAVFDEIEAAENTKHMSGQIMEAFEQAVNENTVMKTGAGFLRTPGSVYALHQHLQPTFKDIEGTVRAAAMDNTFKNVTPAPGDFEYKISQKRNMLRQYLKAKASAPTARGYGIDLGKFKSTSTDPMISLEGQQLAEVQAAKRNPNDPRAKLILKKYGVE